MFDAWYYFECEAVLYIPTKKTITQQFSFLEKKGKEPALADSMA